MGIIFNKLPLPATLTQTHNSSALALLTSLESEPGDQKILQDNAKIQGSWAGQTGNEIHHTQCINSALQFPQKTGYFPACLAHFNFLSFKNPFKNYRVLTVKS